MIPGGFSAVEYSPDPNMVIVKEIGCELKEGTIFEPIEMTDELANGKDRQSGKGYNVNVRSAELDPAVYTDLKSAEEAHTPLHFRYLALSPIVVIDDCEDAWNESVGANVTSTFDTVVKKRGSGSVKLDVAVGAVVGNLATEAISPSINLTQRKQVSLWIQSSIALNAGDLQLLLDDTANCASPLETLNLPALNAGEMTKVYLTLNAPANLSAVISVGLKMAVDKGAFVLNIDEILGVPANWILKSVIPQHVDNPATTAKLHAKKIMGKNHGATEADVIAFTS